MNVNEFNDDYPNDRIDKLSKENKTIILFGDFYIHLLNYDTHLPPIELLGSLSSHYLLPHILQPTRVSSNSKKWITFSLIWLFSI